MNEKQTSIDWRFWRHWVLFSTLGYGIGGFVGYSLAVYMAVASSSSGPLPPFAIGGVITGISVGLAQWQAIRLKALHADKATWIIWNTIGMGISWVLFHWIMFTYYYPETMPYAFLLTGFFWGVLSSIIQRHALQGQIHRPALWFALNSLCGILVLGVGLIWIPAIYFGYMSNSGSDVFGFLFISIVCSILFWPIAGLLYGLVTGSLLTWLIREPNQPDELNEHVLVG